MSLDDIDIQILIVCTELVFCQMQSHPSHTSCIRLTQPCRCSTLSFMLHAPSSTAVLISNHNHLY